VDDHICKPFLIMFGLTATIYLLFLQPSTPPLTQPKAWLQPTPPLPQPREAA
jgi:hypothetical protein